MHELSIVMGIIKIVLAEAERADAEVVEEIELDIGRLSTVEMDSFEFAWRQGVKNTILEGAKKNINRIGGMARCLDCAFDFPLEQVFDPCPLCGQHLISIIAGKELRVRSLVVRGE